MTRYRVVFQVSEADPHVHETTLRNVRNTAVDLGPDAEIALVAHGPGIRLLTGETGFGDQISGLLEGRIQVLGCRNTLDRLQIPDDQVLPGVEIVTAGIAEIVRRQHEGWAYVRP